jgi:cyclic-di-GMP-binding protein
MEDHTTIKLKIPRQDFTGSPLFQPNTEAASNWVRSLPVTNTNSLVQLLDQALSDLNRTKLSAESRYSIIEILLPSLNVALANLSKRFLNQPLIMPEEPRSMVERSDRLLSMATTAYTIVGIEAIQQRDAIRETNPARLTCQAIQRALVFAGRRVLQHLQLHKPIAIHSWLTLHQLYTLADIQRLTDLPVPEPLSGGSTIKATYLQALMLGCCKPNQLRQNDLMALYRGLQSWSDLIQLNNVETGDDLFLVDLDADEPPLYRALYREQPGPLCRTINTAGLLEHLKNLRQEMDVQGVSFDKNTSVLSNVLDHVIASLGSMSLRNFKRTRANSPLWICLGISSVHYHVARQRLFEQMLYGDKYVAAATMVTQDNRFLSPGSDSDTWGKANPEQDYVRAGEDQLQGHIEIDAATRVRLLQEENPELPLSDRYPVYKVQLADTSPGGYCLDWVDELPGDIKTGDLIGLKEKEDQKEWVIAVIRWLSRLENAKTLIGLELFSPRALAYGARIHLKGGEKTPPMRVLLLPEIRLMGQPQTLITPRAGFKERQTVTLRNSDESRTIRLQRNITSTASFEQFEFRYIKELGDVLAESLNGPAGTEYDSLWSNI